MQFIHQQMHDKISCFHPVHHEPSLHRSNDSISYTADKNASIIAISYRRITSLMWVVNSNQTCLLIKLIKCCWTDSSDLFVGDVTRYVTLSPYLWMRWVNLIQSWTSASWMSYEFSARDRYCWSLLHSRHFKILSAGEEAKKIRLTKKKRKKDSSSWKRNEITNETQKKIVACVGLWKVIE